MRIRKIYFVLKKKDKQINKNLVVIVTSNQHNGIKGNKLDVNIRKKEKKQ